MIEKINHIGIAVPNLDEAIETYKNLGFSIQGREIVASQKVEVAMIQIGDSHIELLQPTVEDSPIAKFLEKKGPGIHHFAVSVDDIEKAIFEYEQKGVRMIDTVPRDGAHGTKIAFGSSKVNQRSIARTLYGSVRARRYMDREKRLAQLKAGRAEALLGASGFQHCRTLID